jgi:hypothetical protein
MSATLEAPISLSYEEEYGKPMPSRNHAIAQARLAYQFMSQGKFEVASELTVDLQTGRFTPDLALFPRRQIDWTRDVVRETEPPLTCVEIFSPQQGTLEVMEKVLSYLDAGVKSCWVVAPPLRTISIYLPGKDPLTFSTGRAVDPATGLEADVSAVFA